MESRISFWCSSTIAFCSSTSCFCFEIILFATCCFFSPLKIKNANNETTIKLPIGIFVSTEEKKFTNHSIQLQKNDAVYVFSDGYCDQFGGPKGKKFMASRFRELLLSIQHKSMIEQRNELFLALENWRANEDQVDDVLVIGVKV